MFCLLIAGMDFISHECAHEVAIRKKLTPEKCPTIQTEKGDKIFGQKYIFVNEEIQMQFIYFGQMCIFVNEENTNAIYIFWLDVYFCK